MSGNTNQSGSISLDVDAGDDFGFEIETDDGCCGAAFLTISSLVTPEPPDTGDAAYSISGTTSAGSTLTTSVSTNDPDGNGTVSSYTWQSSSDGTTWTSITGATGSTYTLTESEEGKYIRVTVDYTDGSSTSESVTASSVTIPHVDSGDAVFAISGSTYAGKILTAAQSSSDPDGDGTFSYKWQSSSDNLSWTDISGATNSTFTVTESEEGKYIRLVITYTDLQNFSESVTASSVTIPHVDSGDAVFAISGSTYAGKILTAAQSSSDPDGDGTFSYKWQSSSDNLSWTDISGATNSTFTVTESEEGKYIRLVITYTDLQNFSESVLVSAVLISQLHTEWVQPYAAMQNIGLASIKNNRDLVLAKAGECNKYGWVIGYTDYCVYTNANNTNASVNGNSSYGGYDYAKFNTSINIEKTINDRWKAGVAYGVGSSNLDNYNFSSTTASLSSTNTHYSIYGVKKVSDKFTLKGMIGGSDFDYKGNRNYSTTSATSAYDTDGYTAEINAIWDIKKNIKNMKTPIRLKPSVRVAYAAHTQDGFSESGSGDLVTIDPNQAESLLFKTGISVDKQIPMEAGKWILVPSLALNYEMDPYADEDHRSIKGGLTESSTVHTQVSSKTLGQHNGSVKVGADFICTKNFMFNLNAEYGLAEGGDEQSYGGGFSWQF
ncbi:autotransporter domain-containing protein [Prochlorococcus sp. AH-716-N03]|nr:autotransporter domain-containing protein [Prochlorococcus sp. AH-716-N03]